jgi:Rieske 2Fe-2S family protein
VIHHQDIAACEAVWAGLTSRSVESGRLSHLERSIWQFNQWWIERMAEPS